MSVETIGSARANLRACERSIAGLKRQNHHASIAHLGPMVAMRAAAPPPVAEYDAWLEGRAPKCGRGVHSSRHFNMTGAKLRRIVVMLRGGCMKKEAAQAIGVSARCLTRWLSELPEYLS